MNREQLTARYVETIGYDPFADDPTISEETVYRTLCEYVAELKREAEAASDAFDAACKPHYCDGRWGAYRAYECDQPVPKAVESALNQYHAALHAYYLARDGERGFLG